MQQKETGSAPVDYYAIVWIHETALRAIPDIYAPIESTVNHGEVLHIVAEHEDGLCQTDDGMWVLGAALKKQE